MLMFYCKTCGAEYEENDNIIECSCGEALCVKHKTNFSKTDIILDNFSMWRYQNAYPIKLENNSVTLGEGLTPVIPVKWSGHSVFIKNEGIQPSGSFKDRGTVMIINHLKKMGITSISEDSSGNAGSSYSTYCAKANIACNIYVPSSTSIGKQVQIMAHGAEIHLVDGTRDETALVARNSTVGKYVGHNWHPLFVEGVKSIAYELWEQFDFSAPEHIIAPVGNGSIILGLYQGFKELFENDLVKKIPKLYGVNPQNSNSTYRLYMNIKDKFKPKPTIAEGVAIQNSSRSNEVLHAIREAEGDFYSISEESIQNALKKTIKKGFFIEPTSAVAFAGLDKLLNSINYCKGDSVVVIATGNGLKASNEIYQILNNE